MDNYNIGIAMLFIGVGVGKLDSEVDVWRAAIFIAIGLTLFIVGELRSMKSK